MGVDETDLLEAADDGYDVGKIAGIADRALGALNGLESQEAVYVINYITALRDAAELAETDHD